MNYQFHPQALEEYAAAARYYAECQSGLEQRFMDAVEQTVQKILDAPESWLILKEDVRRCLTPIFPYAVLYTIESGYVLIIAVMHCHRKPDYWHSRLM
jgi:hypothetical protein